MKEYEVDVAGVPHTMQLDDADAKRYGDRAVPLTKARATAPANKTAAPAEAPVDPTAAGVDLDTLTVPQLKERAAALGIEVPASANRADTLAALEGK